MRRCPTCARWPRKLTRQPIACCGRLASTTLNISCEGDANYLKFAMGWRPRRSGAARTPCRRRQAPGASAVSLRRPASPAPGRARSRARAPALAIVRRRMRWSGRLQFSITTTGVSARRPCSSRRCAVAIASRPPMYCTSVSVSGMARCSVVSGAVLDVKKATLRDDAALGQRLLGCRRRRQRGGDAGDDFDFDAGFFQRAQFFVGAAEQHRVAAFQAHHQRDTCARCRPAAC